MAVRIQETPTQYNAFQRNFTITINNTHTIDTTVTSNPGTVEHWIWQTMRLHYRHMFYLTVGIAIQSRNDDNDHASTLQLCVGRRCLIYQLNHSNATPAILHRFLGEYPYITFVYVGRRPQPQDFAQQLYSDHHPFVLLPGMPIDVRSYAAAYIGRPPRGCSVDTICRRFLGCDVQQLDAQTARSNWEVPLLSRRQVVHASVMAFLAFVIGRSIINAWRLNPVHQAELEDDDDDDEDDDDDSDDSDGNGNEAR